MAILFKTGHKSAWAVSKNATKLVRRSSRVPFSYQLHLQVTRSLSLETGHLSLKEFVNGLSLSGEQFPAVPPKEASHNCKTTLSHAKEIAPHLILIYDAGKQYS